MFLKAVVMDGFKCYSAQATIRNIDRSFTAITGLNGSGKSNIIDAIVFALDLGTSKLMRVSALRELINVQRKECSVTLAFSNGDKAASPSGYEHCDTIEVMRHLDGDGKSRFRLNGHNCTRGTIEKMCRSVGITSDFIVMQGHITKIINMKGSELRSMVEEAAGTRSYNTEKERAREELEKKEAKLREAREYLQKNISPFLDGLLKEKKIYEENRDFEARKAALSGELNELERRKHASEVSKMQRELECILCEYVKDRAELDELNTRLQDIGGAGAEVDLVDLKSKISEELLRMEEWREQKAALDKMRTELARTRPLTTRKYNKEQLLEKERILSKEACNSFSSGKIEELEQRKVDLCKLEARRHHLLSELRSGYDSGVLQQGHSMTLIIQGLMDAIDGPPCMDSTVESYIASISEALEHSARNQPAISQLTADINVLRSKIIYPAMPGVYGTVDENFDLIDVKYKEAIFTILGGRAKYIICEDDSVGAEVLRQSDRRVSCIPLNKIAMHGQTGVPCRGLSALKAIRYDPKYDRAYKHIFNNYYIFEGKAEASESCFKYKVMCVTLDGAVYDPKGTLTGGKSHYKQEVVRMKDILDREHQLERLAKQVLSEQHARALAALSGKIAEYRRVLGEMDGARAGVSLLEKMCGGGGVDVRKELLGIRNEIIEATKEENTLRTEEQRHAEMLVRAREMERTVQQNDILMEQSSQLLSEYQRTVHEVELRTSTKKASVVEGMDLRKEHLIKSTVRLANKIRKLYENILKRCGSGEAGEGAGIGSDGVIRNAKKEVPAESILCGLDCEKENASNSIAGSSRSGTGQGGTDGDYAMILDEFNINPSIFTHASNIDLSSAELVNLEGRIANIRSELSARRSRSTMDPASFELLEKNVAVIKDLEAKISRLEQDKISILASITKLTELGMRENEKAFSHINGNLQKFFGYFIKNAEISIGSDYEIKVRVGEWENSISELSGGQRSLVALCLIFSMLAYKMAPFYIFDEIDAALDLNYTQGIGEIIQREFKNAQFIIVSLKNNMFENANKIYRVFIQDSRSCIMEVK